MCDVHIDGARVAEIVVAPHKVQQSIALQDEAQVLDKCGEQIELFEAQLNFATVNSHFVAVQIDARIAELHRRAACYLCRLKLGTPPQYRLDARHKLAWIERL